MRFFEVYKNSVIADAVRTLPQIEVNEIESILRKHRCSFSFFADKVRYTILGTRTMKVPAKLSQDISQLKAWIAHKVESELNK